MASIVKGRGLALALVIFIVMSSSFDAVTATHIWMPYNPHPHRKLATDCDSPVQGEIPGCGGGGGSGGSPRPRPRPRPSSSRCKKGCCGRNKFGECMCC